VVGRNEKPPSAAFATGAFRSDRRSRSGESGRALLVEVRCLLERVGNEQVLFVLEDRSHDVHARRQRGGGAALAAESAPRPPPPPPPRPPRPPRPKFCGIAKPVGTTIDGVPTMLVTDVFSRG